MPFYGYDPWDEQYFAEVNERVNVVIPCSDYTAYTAHAGFEWLHDRLQLSRCQSITAYPHGIEPHELPV